MNRMLRKLLHFLRQLAFHNGFSFVLSTISRINSFDCNNSQSNSKQEDNHFYYDH